MTRIASAAPVALAAFVIALALAALSTRTGLIQDDTVNLWAGALAASDGEAPIGRVIAAYPSIPFLASSFVQWITPAATPAPALLASGLLAALGGSYLLTLRAAGFGLAFAFGATALIVLHPALLRAAVAGPTDMFFAVFLSLLAGGLADLRLRSSAPEVMTVGLALIGLCFSHPMGAALGLAALPVLTFAVAPALVGSSALNMLVALVFPTLFCLGAFSYVSWVFPGSGWSFLTAPAHSLADWLAGLSIAGAPSMPVLAAGVGMGLGLALAVSAPLAVVALARARRRYALVTPPLILAVSAMAAAMLSVSTGLFGDPIVLTAAAPILAMTALARIPDLRRDSPWFVAALLAAGWVGGALTLSAVDPRVGAAVMHRQIADPGDRDRVDALNLGSATVGKDAVLVDTFNSPAVLLGRGQARGLLGPNGEDFELAMLFRRLDAPFVAVPDPASATGALDRLNRAFPQLYHRGTSGYRLVYRNSTWRLYARD